MNSMFLVLALLGTNSGCPLHEGWGFESNKRTCSITSVPTRRVQPGLLAASHCLALDFLGQYPCLVQGSPQGGRHLATSTFCLRCSTMPSGRAHLADLALALAGVAAGGCDVARSAFPDAPAPPEADRCTEQAGWKSAGDGQKAMPLSHMRSAAEHSRCATRPQNTPSCVLCPMPTSWQGWGGHAGAVPRAAAAGAPGRRCSAEAYRACSQCTTLVVGDACTGTTASSEQ